VEQPGFKVRGCGIDYGDGEGQYISVEIPDSSNTFTIEVDLFLSGRLEVLVQPARRYLQNWDAHRFLSEHVPEYKRLLRECSDVLAEHLKKWLEEDLEQVEKLKEMFT
jgi:hypothetical protein